MFNKKCITDVNLKNKTVIVRVDYNVPIKDKVITDNKRIVASIPTLKHLIENNCKIILLSHLSRIKSLNDIKSGKKSLKIVADELKKQLKNVNVIFCEENTGKNVIDQVNKLKPQEILVLENTRYNDVNEKGEVVKKESKCDPELGKFWASLADVFVNDAFGTVHRKHASNAGIANNIKTSCIGFLIENELENLQKVADKPQKPFISIVGGAKISDKLKVVEQLLNKSNKVLIGGAMAFTFLKAQGHNIGKSLVETEMVSTAKNMLDKYGEKIVLPVDFYCAPNYEDVESTYRTLDQGLEGLMGLDVGPKTTKIFEKELANAKTVIWNGPIGVSEFKNFSNGTKELCNILKKCHNENKTFIVIGGGDSAAAAINLGFKESDFGFISTGGGASLALIEGSSLPGIESIQDK